MRISVVGCGYLGAVHAASMAELGHDVVGIDVDARKVAGLSQRRPPFYEPGFEELLDRTLATGRLRFSTDVSDAAVNTEGSRTGRGALPGPSSSARAGPPASSVVREDIRRGGTASVAARQRTRWIAARASATPVSSGYG